MLKAYKSSIRIRNESHTGIAKCELPNEVAKWWRFGERRNELNADLSSVFDLKEPRIFVLMDLESHGTTLKEYF